MNLKYRSIVVAGDVGTGTSTLAKELAEKLGWKYLSAGDFFRKYHKRHNIPLWDKKSIPDELDQKVDLEFLERMKKKRNIVFDSHYGAWFARNLDDVFRILLVTDKEIATKRILDREHTHEETPEEIERRRVEIRAKFKKLYSSENYEDPKIFNLIIDTTKTGLKETVKKAYKALSEG